MIHRLRSGIVGVLLCAVIWLGSFQFASAQSSPNVGNPPPAQNSTDKKPDKPAVTSDAPAPPITPRAKKPKVITNDDIKADRARHNDGFAGGTKDKHAIPGTGICDDECADEAREIAGFGPDQEGEWRFALTAARRSLATDPAWPGAYATLARAVKTYCTFQAQLQTAAVPSGNDYGARVERARREKYVEDMSRALGQSVTNANAQIDRMAQEADGLEPGRSAIMRVLAQRVNDSCDP
jgi:hypothetical protein